MANRSLRVAEKVTQDILRVSILIEMVGHIVAAILAAVSVL